MIAKKLSVDQTVCTLPFFKDLPLADAEQLLNSATIQWYPKNTLLIQEGNKAELLFILINGRIKLYNVNERDNGNNEENIVTLCTSGDILISALYLNPPTYPYFARTTEESLIATIPGEILKQIMQRSPSLAEEIIMAMAERLRNVKTDSSRRAMMHATQRVACLLLQESYGMLGSGGTFRLPYDKSVAASRLGIDGATFSRALAKLEELGVTSHHHEITIRSFSALVENTCANCPLFDCACAKCRGKVLLSKVQAS